jgi:NADH dehydrogenase FAD-containing subunit
VEAAFAVQRMLERSPHGSVVTIVDAGQSILAGAARCAPTALQLLESRGVCFALGARVVEVRATGLVLASGAVLSANLVLWATGADAPSVIRASGLPHDDEGRLRVDERLRAVDGSPVWAVGDAVTRAALGDDGPRTHRLAATLEHELRIALGDRWHRGSRPGREGCRIDTGDERAVTEGPPYRGHSQFGGWLKRRLDRRFVEM